MSAPRLILHYLNRSRAHRVLWLLEECKLEYKLLTYTRLPDQTAPAALKKIHPLGKSPVLEVWEGERQRVLAESAYIVESVAERFGAAVGLKRGTEGGRGKDEKEEERERERFYMHYSEGSLMNLVGTGALKNGIRDAPVPFFLKPFTSRIAKMIETQYLNINFETHLSFLEDEMSGEEREFICGKELSAADFMMVFPLEACSQIGGLTGERYPALWAYMKRMMARDAYKKAVERIVKETGVYSPGI